MSVQVTTQFFSHFQVPTACVACGDPPAPGAKWKVSHTRSRQKFSSTEYKTMRLEFPMCEQCQAASRTKFLGGLVYALGFLVVGVLVIIGVRAMENASAATCMPVLLGLPLSLILASLARERINRWGMSPEQVERRKLVKRCVQIKRFDEKKGIVFEFKNPGFATQFANLNLGTAV
jgi:hypothetical protein